MAARVFECSAFQVCGTHALRNAIDATSFTGGDTAGLESIRLNDLNGRVFDSCMPDRHGPSYHGPKGGCDPEGTGGRSERRSAQRRLSGQEDDGVVGLRATCHRS